MTSHELSSIDEVVYNMACALANIKLIHASEHDRDEVDTIYCELLEFWENYVDD